MNSVWKVLETRGPGLHAMLLRLTLRSDAAEELMQELFVKLSMASGFVAADDPAAYARRAAINLAMDWRRSRIKSRGMQSMDVEPVGKGRRPDELVEQADDVEKILDAAQYLTELAREAFVLHFVEQESYKRVGELMGKTAHQARGLCHAAVAQVRERLGGKQVCHEAVE